MVSQPIIENQMLELVNTILDTAISVITALAGCSQKNPSDSPMKNGAVHYE